MSQWYEPHDTWPEHDKPHWRKPMAQAQQAGWSLEYINAPHLFGYVTCPEKQHKFKIDKTASGSAFWAAEASKIITRNCRHGQSSGAGKVRDRHQQALSALATLGSLLESIECDIVTLEAITEGWQRAVRLEQSRDALLLRLETVELTLAELDDSTDPAGDTGEDEVAALDAELEEEIAALEQLEPGPDTADLRTQLGEAEIVIGEVELLTTKLSRRPGLAGELHADIDAARTRHVGLVARLGVLERRPPLDG